MIHIKIFFVDESITEYDVIDPNFSKRLKKLQESGYKGKELINNLISDDWAAPPRTVRIIGSDSNDGSIDIRINYK